MPLENVHRPLRLGTRGSLLALTQSRGFAGDLRSSTGRDVELEVITTKGDRIQDRPLPEIGGKGLFTAELDRALLDGRIDLAVHSLKDLPTEPVAGLALGCVPVREDPRDVLVGPKGKPATLGALPKGARVGTSSLRRRAMVKAFRPDLEVVGIRGNLDTRLAKLDDGQADALVLAAAGLLRLERGDRVDEWMEPGAWVPAAAQGALGVVIRADDRATRQLLQPLLHGPTWSAVHAERSFLHALQGGCQVPIGAHAQAYGRGLRLRGLVAAPDGRRIVRGDRTGATGDPQALGHALAEELRERGAEELLAEARPTPPPAAP